MEASSPKPRLLRIISAGLAGALGTFAIPVAPAPAKTPAPLAAKQDAAGGPADTRSP
jgi:hypothetical protein